MGAALLVLVLGGCSAAPSTAEHDRPLPVAKGKPDMSDARPEDDARVTSCGDLACLQAHEGEVVDLVGTFGFPPDRKRKGQHRFTVTLADGTKVILPNPATDALRETLAADNDRQPVAVRGRIYTRDIPEQYGIIESTADPHVVELFAATISR